MIVGTNKFKIGDEVRFIRNYRRYSDKGEIVDLRVKKNGAMRVIQYRVHFEGLKWKHHRNPRYWFNENDLERWKKAGLVERFFENYFFKYF